MRAKVTGIRLGILVIFVYLLGIGLIINSSYAQDCPEAEPDLNLTRIIIMDTLEEGERTLPVITFDHLSHAMDYGCATCHHKWDPATEAAPTDCFDCHSNTEERKGPDSYFAAFHDRQSEFSCVGCHAVANQEDESLGAPIRCNDCHAEE
ncbi:MAG: cytochrome c3 family protein [bacterium]